MAGLHASGRPGADYITITEQGKALGVRSVNELYFQTGVDAMSDWVYMDFNHGETALLALVVWLDYQAVLRRAEDLAAQWASAGHSKNIKYGNEELVQGATLFGPNRWHRPVVPGDFSGYGTQWAQLRYYPGEEWNYAWIMEPDTAFGDTTAIPREYELPVAATDIEHTSRYDFLPFSLLPADHQVFPSHTGAEINHSSRVVWGWVPFENINAMSRQARGKPSNLWADRVFVVHETVPHKLPITIGDGSLTALYTTNFVPSDGDARSFMPLTEYLVNLGLMTDNNG